MLHFKKPKNGGLQLPQVCYNANALILDNKKLLKSSYLRNYLFTCILCHKLAINLWLHLYLCIQDLPSSTFFF